MLEFGASLRLWGKRRLQGGRLMGPPFRSLSEGGGATDTGAVFGAAYRSRIWIDSRLVRISSFAR